MATPKVSSTSTGKRPHELVDKARRPPAVPRTMLDVRARQLWRELFREPVSDLWRPADRGLVVRLVLLRVRLERDPDAPGWVYAAVSALEDRLLLNPRARRAAGIVYVSPVAPAASAKGGPKVRRLDERRRARLARGA